MSQLDEMDAVGMAFNAFLRSIDSLSFEYPKLEDFKKEVLEKFCRILPAECHDTVAEYKLEE